MAVMTPRGGQAQLPEREMTKRDWMALHLVMQLQEQIALYGEVALHNFVAAAREAK